MSTFSWCLFSAASFFACFFASLSCLRAALLLLMREMQHQLGNEPPTMNLPSPSSKRRQTLLVMHFSDSYSTFRHLHPRSRVDTTSSLGAIGTATIEWIQKHVPTVPFAGVGWASVLGRVLDNQPISTCEILHMISLNCPYLCLVAFEHVGYA